MPFGLRILLILISILTMLYMLRKIRQSRLQIEYGVFWIIFAAMLIFASLFPSVVIFFTNLLGFQGPINFVFMFIIFILILKIFFMTIQLSQLENKVKDLVQKIAIEEKIKEEKQEKVKEEHKK